MVLGQDAEPKQPETKSSALSRREQIEKERLTRRAALRKFGFGAGMAALMSLSVDELARMAAVKLQQNAGNNKIANAVANEFKSAGVAFATDCGECIPPCTPDEFNACVPCTECYRNGVKLRPKRPVCHKVSPTSTNTYGCKQCSTTLEVPAPEGHSAREWCCNEVFNDCFNACVGTTAGCSSGCNSTAYDPCMAS